MWNGAVSAASTLLFTFSALAMQAPFLFNNSNNLSLFLHTHTHINIHLCSAVSAVLHRSKTGLLAECTNFSVRASTPLGINLSFLKK